MPDARLPLVEEWDRDLRGGDPLEFPGYARQLSDAAGEPVITGITEIAGQRAAMIDLRFDRLGGTMGVAAGEKITRAFDRATAQRLAVLAITATGGVRLQEGTLALAQMGRTAAARRRHASAGLLMAAVYRSPTTGGVYASWAGLADVRAGVRAAVIGFGGPRVVAAVSGQPPPADSHTAEAAYAAGLIDAVLSGPGEIPGWLAAALGAGGPPLRLPAGRAQVGAHLANVRPAAPSLPPGSQALPAARAPDRPSGLEWAAALTLSWTDLHGSDPVIRAGLATIGGSRAVVVAMDRHARGDAAARPGPAGYRLAQRAIGLADQLGLPLLTLVDTPGAEPGPAAERDGIAGEIARTLGLMADLRSPSVSLCVGEACSGGAMALSHADRLFMLTGSVFPVISPESAAVILRRRGLAAPELADALGITAADLLRLGLADALLPGAGDAVTRVRDAILDAFATARPGDRNRRIDRATRRALRVG
jgi:acyl-CoA carboxylase subunit beta